jgi:hypothetical protein
MKRRLFLKTAALGSGAALAGGAAFGLDRPARAAALGLLDRAGLAPVARLTRYDGAHPAATLDLALAAGGVARGQIGEATWSCVLRATPVKGGPGRPPRPPALDLVATFKLERGAAQECGLGFGLAFSRWSRGDYVLLPGVAYAGNRFESRHLAYPPRLTEAADVGPHVPTIISDIPRLNVHAGSSRLQVLAADLATPAVGVHAAAAKLGVLVLVEPATRVGLSSLTLEENEDRSRARLVVGAPGVREDVVYAAGNMRLPSKDRGAAFRTGETLALRLRVHVFDCPEVEGLFEALALARKDLTGPTARPPERPFSASFAAHEARVNARFVPEAGVFSLSARPGAVEWQSGWCGGLAATLPLLAFGEPPSRERARRTLAFLFKEAQAPSGFFRSSWDGERWHDDGPTPPRAGAGEAGRRSPAARHAGRWHLVRRSADALTFAAKQLLVLRRLEPSTKPEAPWLAGLGRAADAFVRLWDREKQLGQYVDVETGDLIVGGSTAAGLAPAGLALAGALLERDDCLETAHAAAEQYYERWVRAGLTCGGTGDALQCPDGESAAALLESFMTLYEQSGDKVWLPRARAAARLVSSWVISYDAPDAARAGALRATGAVFSNAQNGRGAPGYTLASGDALLRLYRATADVACLDLLRDTVHNLAQYLPAADRADREAPPAGERPPRRARADTTDWLDGAPDVVPAARVFDASSLLSYSEVPGVYVRTDAGFVYVFDHVEARVRERVPGRFVVTIRNPTAFDAAVRVLAEGEAAAAKPLGPGGLLGARVVGVRAGGAVDVELETPIAAGR